MTNELERGRLRLALPSGREVSLRQLHVELSTLGVLEGRFEFIRQQVIEFAPRRAMGLFGADIGLCLMPPPPGELPTYLFFADLVSFEPVHDGAFSSLAVCWFVDTLPADLVAHLAETLRAVDWDALAVDGDF